MADPSRNPKITIEQRLEELENSLSKTQQENVLLRMVIGEYRQSLEAANYALAINKAQQNLAKKPTE
ncbi:hypothetical protein [Glutamicibacter sp.]|uniref:hypothetical protein n=1 Tax=Glutamicibacter sp. TaxID=1931995 RepID=UPI0028BDC8F5|nr:hypothetical protein [Glutamicibacter sp.]